MIQNDKLKFEQVVRGGLKVILLQGVIDEDTNLKALLKLGGSVTFNFKGITSINSLGIRTWVNFIKELGDTEIVYEECPPVIVRQLNMIPSFKAGAKVSSVYVPYVCDECDDEKLSLVSSAKFKEVPEYIPCENCKKGEMEFDGTPDQYFAFCK